MNVLIIGSGAREHALARAFVRATSKPILFCCATNNNPGIRELCSHYWIGDINNCKSITSKAKEWKIDIAIIGPEAPLEKGLADSLEEEKIPTVGPKKALARIETSKSFTRDLLKKYGIKGSPHYQTFHSLQGVDAFLKELGPTRYVIKADGLMGGKGVKVAGDHLHSFAEAKEFCNALIAQNLTFVIEEKLIGQEFSFLCFTDGKTVAPMPLVQDHKRAFINDKGPNTGGMGSYTDANHSLPFLTKEDVTAAQRINHEVLNALNEECDTPYRGILYGSFMATREGVYLIEYNARFGDPEAINVLALLESDFTELCFAITSGSLLPQQVRFKSMATVLKYAVPLGYPDNPLKNVLLDISKVSNQERLYFAAVNEVDGRLFAQGSRAIAALGIAPTISEAEKIAEETIHLVQGPLFHRQDIGTHDLISHRVQMMKRLREEEVAV